jgi:iron complex transport system permease protein
MFAAALCLGLTSFTPMDVCKALLDTHPDADTALTITELRLPRVVLALLVGGALSAAGLLMQTVTRNPLATPSVLGVTNGAHLAWLLAIVFVPSLGPVGVLAATFGGAAAAAGVIGLMGLTSASRMDREYLVVGGSLMGALLGSVTVAIMFLSHMYAAILGWTMGGLIRVNWAQVLFVLPLLAAGMFMAVLMIRRLEALLLGDSIARSLGVRTGVYFLLAMVAVVLLAGGSVAAAGPVAYVGLVVPNILSRRLIPGAMTRLLACVGGGAMLTCGADTLSRVLSSGKVIPMGIWTMSIGAAFFLAISVHGRPTASRPR